MKSGIKSLISWIGRGEPIAFIGDDLFYYWKGWIYKYSNQTKHRVVKFHRPLLSIIKESFRIFRRVFRTEIKASCCCEDKLFFFKNKALYVFDCSNGLLNKIYDLPKTRSTPLNSLAISDNDYYIIFGDYYSNNDYGKVNVYGVNKKYEVIVLFSFENKTIRHIHNIIKDESKYYIFTGDNEIEAGIYSLDLDFKNLNKIYTGKPNSRAVVGYRIEDKLIYATDSVETENYIIAIQSDIPRIIKKINGSVIYGWQTSKYIYFSTVVESTEDRSVPKIKRLLSTKRAKGILSNNIELIRIDKKDYSTSTIFKLKKDCMPYKLFQYGSFRLVGNNSTIAICPIATQNRKERIGLLVDE